MVEEDSAAKIIEAINVTTSHSNPYGLTLEGSTTPRNDQKQKQYARDTFAPPAPTLANLYVVGGSVSSATNLLPSDEMYGSVDAHAQYYVADENLSGAVGQYGDPATGMPIDVIDWQTIWGPRCFTFHDSLPDRVRYDHEAARFVVATLNKRTHYFCLAISTGGHPAAIWTVFEFTDANAMQYSNGFVFSVWGDYYLSCWMHTTNQTCVIVQRSVVLTGGVPKMIILDNTNLFSVTDPAHYPPPPYPVHQGSSPRGSLINTAAPCGVFAIVDQTQQALRYLLCTGLNFTATLPITTVTLGQASNFILTGWDSFRGTPCDGPGYGTPGCLLVKPSTSQHYPAFPSYVRMAYYNYGVGDEWLAYGFGHMPFSPQNISGVLWGEIPVDSVVASDAIQPSSYDPVLDGSLTSYWTPVPIYNCYRTLYMVMSSNELNVPATAIRYFYRLAGDPPGEWTGEVAYIPFGISNPAFLIGPNWGFPQVVLNPAIPRAIIMSQCTPTAFWHQSVGLQDYNIEIEYTATDQCNNTHSCTQLIALDATSGCGN